LQTVPHRGDYVGDIILEFKDIENLLEHVKNVISRMGLNDLRVMFPADVTGVSAKGNYVYINISQDYRERGVSRKIDLSLITGSAAFNRMAKQIGLKGSANLKGKKWLFQGNLSFYKPRASFSIWIDTIAPLGESDIASKRREIYLALKTRDALREKEHELTEIEPIRRIAVVSSRTAAGYGDFLSNLDLPDIYRPVIHLYESFMQGSETVPGITKALRRIASSPVKYDVVVITRGGGSASDLMYFDSLDLGLAISKFNREYCPVLSAIGHERDLTIPDFVSWKSFDTPTAAARGIKGQIEECVESLGEMSSSVERELDWHLSQSFIEIDSKRLALFSEKAYNLLARMAEQLGNDTKDISEHLTGVFVKAESEFFLYDSSKYLMKVERLFDEVFSRAGASIYLIGAAIEKELAVSWTLLDSSPLKEITDNVLSKSKNSLESLEKSVIIDHELIEVYSTDVLDKAASDLIDHGGYAASLLFGGVVLKNSSGIVNRIGEVSAGDLLDCYFRDGKAAMSVVKILDKEV